MDKNSKPNDLIPKTSKRTCNIGWAVADAYLEGLQECADQLFGDPEFKRMFDEMRSYINKQLYGDEKITMGELEVTVFQDN